MTGKGVVGGRWCTFGALGIGVWFWAASIGQAALLHRWSFEGNANDSVGGAHAALVNGATISGGQLILANSGTNSDPNINQYATLPIGSTIASLTDFTIETWLTWGGGNSWQRIWDFGTSTSNYMFLTPSTSGSVVRFAIRTSTVSEQYVSSSSILSAGVPVHVVVTLNDATDTVRLFINGVQVDQNPAVTLKPSDLGYTMENWLGRSQFPSDPFLNGSYDEVRIYNQAFSPHLVNMSYRLGPDRLLPAEAYSLATLMDQATAVWHFRDASDLNGGESNFTSNGNFTLGNANNVSLIQALNADGFAGNEGAHPSWGERSSLGSTHELVAAAGDSLTMFARVRYEEFAGVDDVWRVGNTGNADQDTYALELYNGRPRFVVTGAGQSSEIYVLHGETLQTGRWYDITGVFDASAGQIRIYLYSPETGTMLGQPATFSVGFSSLQTFSSMNLLFLEAPNNANGTNTGAQIELAALWAKALSPEEIALLSLVVPEPSSLVILALGGMGLLVLGSAVRRRK